MQASDKFPARTVFQATAFLGSFLLFTMEPFAGRILTRHCGGAAIVWLACLCFFQFLLLGSYGYAHWLTGRRQGWHLALLVSPLLVSPPFLLPQVAVTEPGFAALAALAWRHLALPLFCLSTTAVILQQRLALARPTGNPYPLYSFSNLGALAALAAYPLIIEPLGGLKQQGLGLTFAYALYAALMALCFGLSRPAPQPPGPPNGAAQVGGPARRCFLRWAMLSALTSALLVAASGVIAADTGSFPLVWAAPLGMYLLSFSLAFRDGSRIAGLAARFWPETVLLGLLLFLIPAQHYSFYFGHCLVCLALCLTAHSILYEERPPAGQLTVFYTAIAAGGLLGGSLTALIAPLVLNRLWEYPLLLSFLAVVFYRRHGLTAGRRAWPGLAPGAALGALLLVVAGYAAGGKTLDVRRNYYGVTSVTEAPADGSQGTVRTLVSGSTVHGSQFTAPGRRGTPTLYYNLKSGLADACRTLPAPARIAALGLGTGTIGVYTRGGDRLDFYEINPAMETLARRWFTYLNDTRAATAVIHGDGRLSLQKSPGVFLYDLIFIDAFSGEGIPAHLLTREALAVYASRLAPDGLILLHVTNRFYNLPPVIKATARELGLAGALKYSGTARAGYVVLARSPERLTAFGPMGWLALGDKDGLAAARPWTDDYVNILATLGL